MFSSKFLKWFYFDNFIHLLIHGFSQNWTIFDPTKKSKLNTWFERSYKELLNALFHFEIGHS